VISYSALRYAFAVPVQVAFCPMLCAARCVLDPVSFVLVMDALKPVVAGVETRGRAEAGCKIGDVVVGTVSSGSPQRGGSPGVETPANDESTDTATSTPTKISLGGLRIVVVDAHRRVRSGGYSRRHVENWKTEPAPANNGFSDNRHRSVRVGLRRSAAEQVAAD